MRLPDESGYPIMSYLSRKARIQQDTVSGRQAQPGKGRACEDRRNTLEQLTRVELSPEQHSSDKSQLDLLPMITLSENVTPPAFSLCYGTLKGKRMAAGTRLIDGRFNKRHFRSIQLLRRIIATKGQDSRLIRHARRAFDNRKNLRYKVSVAVTSRWRNPQKITLSLTPNL
jgi:hypothetical protein